MVFWDPRRSRGQYSFKGTRGFRGPKGPIGSKDLGLTPRALDTPQGSLGNLRDSWGPSSCQGTGFRANGLFFDRVSVAHGASMGPGFSNRLTKVEVIDETTKIKRLTQRSLKEKQR